MENNVRLPYGAAAIDTREAQWSTKREAVTAVKAIGWQVRDVNRVDRMGFMVYVIADDHLRILTWARYSAILVAKQAGRDAPMEA